MDDIGHLATWIFSASGHGKSIVDGIGGCLKQKAADESKMKGLKDPIIDAKSFHNFIIRKQYQTIPILISKEEIDQKELDLDSRWKKSSTLKFFVFNHATLLLTYLMQFGSFPTFINVFFLGYSNFVSFLI